MGLVSAYLWHKKRSWAALRQEGRQAMTDYIEIYRTYTDLRKADLAEERFNITRGICYHNHVIKRGNEVHCVKCGHVKRVKGKPINLLHEVYS